MVEKLVIIDRNNKRNKIYQNGKSNKLRDKSKAHDDDDDRDGIHIKLINVIQVLI